MGWVTLGSCQSTSAQHIGQLRNKTRQTTYTSVFNIILCYFILYCVTNLLCIILCYFIFHMILNAAVLQIIFFSCFADNLQFACLLLLCLFHFIIFCLFHNIFVFQNIAYIHNNMQLKYMQCPYCLGFLERVITQSHVYTVHQLYFNTTPRE